MSQLSPAILWLLAGSILCLMEVFLPTAFVAFLMGISAFLVAFVISVVPTVLSVQVVLWLLLSTGFVFLSRRILPVTRGVKKLDEIEAQALTEIPPGEAGRVVYEGISWRARCEDYGVAISPKEKVYVVRREGTTLFVVPQKLVDD
ncbi:NfeD family protein [Lyngbya aestuarii]|uniref:NfeD family protein n=1 Tax=Lyngbya aestuarii TaxID=118322 RepID=UPI00403DA79C